jgi:hypothetical protein
MTWKHDRVVRQDEQLVPDAGDQLFRAAVREIDTADATGE